MNETEFGYRIRQALNESSDKLDYKTSLRLAQARRTALARQRLAPAQVAVWVPALQTASAGGEPASSWGWPMRLGLAGPVFALLIGFFAIYEWQHQQQIAQLADIDTAVLTDDLPVEAYADRGFRAFLQQATSE